MQLLREMHNVTGGCLTITLTKDDEKILKEKGKVFVRSDNGNADYHWFEIGITFRGKKK